MDDRIKIKHNFEISDDRFDYRSLYSSFKLEILASEIKQKRCLKFGLKNNIISNLII